MINVSLVGGDELERRIKLLDSKMVGRVLADACLEAAQPILDTARELAPQDTGTLKRKGLQLKISRRAGRYGEAVVTNTRAGAHAILQEFGVKAHRLGKRGMHPGHRAQPFMRRAAWRNRTQVLAAIVDDLKRQVMMATEGGA